MTNITALNFFINPNNTKCDINQPSRNLPPVFDVPPPRKQIQCIKEKSTDEKLPVNNEAPANETPVAVTLSEILQPIPVYEIKHITDLNNPAFANKNGVQIEGKYYDFDEQGRVSRVYINKPETNINGTKNSYTFIEYDEEGKVKDYYKFPAYGAINSDGTRTCPVYDAEGNLKEYYIESNFNSVSNEAGSTHLYDSEGSLYCIIKNKFDENGKITNTFFSYYPGESESIFTAELFDNIETMTPDKLNEYLSRVDELGIAKAEDEGKNNFLIIMQKYQEGRGKSLLEDLVENNPEHGKELANMIIENVLKKEKPPKDGLYKYTDDIEKDMKSHPDDYKKLSVDLMRLMNREYIDPEDNHGDDVLNINGEIDEKVEQGNTGDCWIIASLIELSQKPAGAAALKSIISRDKSTGDVIVKLHDKTYRITEEEIVKSDHLSAGEDDMRAIEIAMDKYLRDAAYSSTTFNQYDIDGGNMSLVTQILFGLESEDLEEVSDISDFNNENIAYTFAFNKDNTYGEGGLKCKTDSGEEKKLEQNHQYSIVKTDEQFVYFINPWNSNETLKLNINEFKNLTNLSVERFDLSKLNA